MLIAGTSRRQIANTLNAAYADGLLSEETFSARLDQLFGDPLVDPSRLVGDLNLRSSTGRLGRRIRGAMATTMNALRPVREESIEEPAVLLALDWSGAQTELLLGRHRECDVVLSGVGVSRRHARLVFRDGSWVLHDLESTNGTLVNGVPVGRCRLRPGDHLRLGDELLQID
jgi:hypothetical protein